MAFHRYLNGDGPIPIEHYFGRLSEEFGGALPSALVAEMQRLPVGFLEQILEYRSYAAAYYVNEANAPGWEKSEMRTLAIQIEMALAQEEINAQTNG